MGLSKTCNNLPSMKWLADHVSINSWNRLRPSPFDRNWLNPRLFHLFRYWKDRFGLNHANPGMKSAPFLMEKVESVPTQQSEFSWNISKSNFPWFGFNRLNRSSRSTCLCRSILLTTTLEYNNWQWKNYQYNRT